MRLRSLSAGVSIWLAAFPFSGGLFHAAPLEAARPPNLIAIVTDDQGRWAMGAYGNEQVHTPHMDRIAREGALFTRAFANTPVCSPSRATYLTGLYPTELGITDWISPEEAQRGLGLDAETWPQVLRRHGYRTALIGKWHLGQQPRFHPTKLGFDRFAGFLAGGNRPMDPTLEVAGERRRLEGPLPDILTDHALAFIREHRDRPLAVCLHFRAPHLPYGPVPPRDAAPYEGMDIDVPRLPGLDTERLKDTTRAYYASISSVDRNIGRLLDALDALDLADRTIVLFTSDHGYNEGRHYIKTKGNGPWIAGGVYGPKRPNMWDTSVMIPLAIRWPGVVEPGTVIDRMVCNLDVYRSVLGMLGLPAAEDAKARGVDFSPLLRGEPATPPQAVFGQYDLHNGGLAYMRMIRTDRYKYIRHFHAQRMDEFYDLRADPDERRNLLRSGRVAADDYEEVQRDLHQRLMAWMRSIDDPLLDDRY